MKVSGIYKIQRIGTDQCYASGKKQSQEQIAKKSASLRAYHERRRNAGLA